MLIFDRFVFLHMPKTGGSFLSQALREELSAPVGELETHAGWGEIPSEAARLPVLMYVRNPWDWYVSWYLYWTRTELPQAPVRVRRDPMVQVLFGERLEPVDGGMHGVNDFATTIRAACERLEPSNPVVAEMIERRAPHVESMATGDDFYTARFKYLAGAGVDSDRLTIGRFESLLHDLERFLVSNDIPFEDDLMPRIEARDPVNVSNRHPYRDYYDDELRDLVGRRCEVLVERFDYRF